jgi:lipopolysaccharide transport system permease protein
VLVIVGFMLPIATLGAFYDDVQHSLPIVFLMLFYMSPVFYPAALVPASVSHLYRLNPLAGLLGLYQTVIYEGRFPAFSAVAGMVAVGASVCVAGSLVFRRYRGLFAEVL